MVLTLLKNDYVGAYSTYIENADSIKPHKSNVYIIEEIIGDRTRYNKTFLNSDNTYTVQSSFHSLHYQENGMWKDIDTQIEKTNSSDLYSARENEFTVEFRREKFELFGEDGRSISFYPLDSFEVEGISFNNKMFYRNLWENTSLQYTVRNDDIQMELILLNENTPLKFSFEIDSQDLNAELIDHAAVNYVDNEGNLLFHMSDFVIKDSASEELHQDRVEISLKPFQGRTVMELIIDTTSLQYPLSVASSTATGHYHATPDSSTWTNKIYMDTPDIEVKNIVNIRFENQGGYGFMGGRSADVYLTREEYGNLRGFGFDSPEPGKDGRNAVWVGKTNYSPNGRASIDISGDMIRSYFGNSGKVYGGAVWNDRTYVDYGWIYITYVPDYLPPTGTEVFIPSLVDYTEASYSVYAYGVTDPSQ